jgi:hypothetical protein
LTSVCSEKMDSIRNRISMWASPIASPSVEAWWRQQLTKHLTSTLDSRTWGGWGVSAGGEALSSKTRAAGVGMGKRDKGMGVVGGEAVIQ